MNLRQLLSKSIVIILLGFFLAVFIIGIFILSIEDNSDIRCFNASNEVEKNPSTETVSDFMNLNTDGEGSYLHLALFGRLFTLYPEIFQKVYEAENTKKHHYFNDLSHVGDGVFEYYPKLEPKAFDEVFLECKWISDKN